MSPVTTARKIDGDAIAPVRLQPLLLLSPNLQTIIVDNEVGPDTICTARKYALLFMYTISMSCLLSSFCSS